MRRLPLLMSMLLFAGTAVAQPDRLNLYSTPRLPSADVLDRLNLKMAWSKRIPTEGRRDGFVSIVVAPVRQAGKTEWHLVAQTRNGLVVEMDAETGEILWRTRIGNPNTSTQPVAFNNRDVIAVRGLDVFALDRKNGNVRWRFQPAGAALGQPLIDGSRLYLNLGEQVDAYALPTRTEGKPALAASHRNDLPLQLRPVQTESYVIYPSPRGSVVVLNKGNMGEFVRFRTEGELTAGPGIHEVEGGLYVGSHDTNLYGFSLQAEPPWRLATGGPIDRTPFVNNADVLVTAEGIGVLRVNRKTLRGAEMLELLKRRGLATEDQLKIILAEMEKQKLRITDSSAIVSVALQKDIITRRQSAGIHYRSGEKVWTAPDGDRVLAANPKFVYAMDGVGRLLLIGRETGRVVSRYDLRDYPVPITNELTDRIFLAAHDGLIVCLHDRDYPRPEEMKSFVKPEAPPRPKPKPAEGDPAMMK